MFQLSWIALWKLDVLNWLSSQRGLLGTTRMEYEAAPEHNSGVHLHYEPTMTSFLQRRRLQTLSESHDEVSLPLTPPPVGRQFSMCSRNVE